MCVGGGVLGLTIETIDLSDLSALMVSSQENHFIRVHGLQSKELSEGLQTVVASVHKVPLEDTPPVTSLSGFVTLYTINT